MLYKYQVPSTVVNVMCDTAGIINICKTLIFLPLISTNNCTINSSSYLVLEVLVKLGIGGALLFSSVTMPVYQVGAIYRPSSTHEHQTGQRKRPQTV